MRGRLPAIVCAGWLAACAAPPAPVVPDSGAPARTVYIVSNGWHAGIVIPYGPVLASGRVPEAADFPGALLLEFGWGDREYYPSPRPTIGMALRAALTPSPAVMHVAPLSRPPAETYPAAEVLSVPVSARALERLIAAIGADFERPDGAAAAAVAPGLYRDSRFYAARGEFHLFNTCNTWAARTLQVAVPGLSSSGVITADELMGRLGALPGMGRQAAPPRATSPG